MNLQECYFFSSYFTIFSYFVFLFYPFFIHIYILRVRLLLLILQTHFWAKHLSIHINSSALKWNSTPLCDVILLLLLLPLVPFSTLGLKLYKKHKFWSFKGFKSLFCRHHCSTLPFLYRHCHWYRIFLHCLSLSIVKAAMPFNPRRLVFLPRNLILPIFNQDHDQECVCVLFKFKWATYYYDAKTTWRKQKQAK